MTKYEFIEAEKKRHPVSWSCRVVGVSRAAYYKSHKKTPRSEEDHRLSGLLREQHRRHKDYGARRHVAELASCRINTTRRRIRRLMKEAGLASSHQRPFVVTTIQGAHAKVPDRVARRFYAAEPNRIWVGDITYVRTGKGWMYVALITDVFSRRIVGWAVADHMRTELVLTALGRARRQRRPGPGLIHHTDLGTQYTSNDWARALATMGSQQSAGATGVCWDNALAESTNGSLKKEAVHCTSFATKQEVPAAISRHVRYFNHRRRHSSLGYLTPAEFEDAHLLPIPGGQIA